jgi:flagellar biosynthesis protein FlhA
VAKSEASPAGPSQEICDSVPPLDELGLEVGYALVPIVDTSQGGQLLGRVRALRRHLSPQLGFVIPPVHITDNLKLKSHEYVVSIRGVEVGRWDLMPNCLLAINADGSTMNLHGIETCEPAFGVSAKWISRELQEQALALGYAVIDHTSIIATHLAELVKRNAHELLSRAEMKRLLDALSNSHPKLVEELTPKLMSLGEVQRILQQLLREQVSIRDLGTLLEALVEAASSTKNPILLVESVRQSLGRALVQSLVSDGGELKVVTIAPSIEEELRSCFDPSTSSQQALQPSFVRRILEGLQNLAGEQIKVATPVVLCGSPARFHLRRILEPFLPNLKVISPVEIPPAVPVRSLGTVR